MSFVHRAHAHARPTSAHGRCETHDRSDTPLFAITRRALAAAIVAVAIVASAPRIVSAQSTTPVQHTVRHTLRAEVGAVTQVALSSLWRPAMHELGGLAIAAPARGATAGHAWMQRADVRSNVPTVLVLEAASPLASDESRGAWQVVDANGDMVPWQNAPVVLSRELPAGRHDVPIVLIAPEGITSAPVPVVRLRIVTGAR